MKLNKTIRTQNKTQKQKINNIKQEQHKQTNKINNRNNVHLIKIQYYKININQ